MAILNPPAFLRPRHLAANGLHIEWQGEAFEPAPAVPDTEQFERVDEGRALLKAFNFPFKA